MLKLCRKNDSSLFFFVLYITGDVAFIHAVDEKKRLDVEVPSLKLKFERLEKQCRALQNRRRELSARLAVREADEASRKSAMVSVVCLCCVCVVM